MLARTVSSGSGRDALEAALAQVVPCTYSLRGSSKRPMAHKTIALTTELREPLHIPRSPLYIVMHQLGTVRQWPTGGLAYQVWPARWVGMAALISAHHTRPSQLKVQWGPAHLVLTGALGDGQYSAAALSVA